MRARGPGRRSLAVLVATALVIGLLIPVGTRAAAAVTGLRFLVEFLTDGERPWLSRRTAPPAVEPLGESSAARDGPDLYRPRNGAGPRPGLVLVHGLTPHGKRDARLAWTADRLARAGFAVAVPELPALAAERLRPEDAAIVRDTIVALGKHPAVRPGPVAVIAVSVGLGPVALALGEPTLAEQVRVVLALGGYADARELVRYFTTGAYAFGGTAGRAPVDPALAWSFLARNLDLVPDPRDRALVARAGPTGPPPADAGPGALAVLALLRNREPGRVDGLLAALPPETQALLDALSPARHLSRTRVRLLLVHGRDDPAIPFTESLRLAAAVPGRARLVPVELIGHVEGQAPAWRRLADFVRLWSVCYELLAG
jgi:pimeloyl-ACP methyl ester carboxylesterase